VCGGRTQNGWTPLHWAARGGQPECARLLLERGAKKGAKDSVRAPTRATAPARYFFRATLYSPLLLLTWQRTRHCR
jgi:hypothetical protein